MRSTGALAVGICLCAFLNTVMAADQTTAHDRFAALRKNMVSRDMRARDITDPAVLAAMEKVPRHLFIEKDRWPEAYADYPISIPRGQTISRPYIVARMTQYLGLKKTDRVLEIGTGSGYQAAVLAELAGRVYTIELEKSLSEHARGVLTRLGYTNISFRCGDGFFGWPEEAPFDAIILTCAPGRLPQKLVDQLREGGRIIAPVGATGQVQELLLGTKHNGQLALQTLTPVHFVPMRGQAEKSAKK